MCKQCLQVTPRCLGIFAPALNFRRHGTPAAIQGRLVPKPHISHKPACFGSQQDVLTLQPETPHPRARPRGIYGESLKYPTRWGLRLLLHRAGAVAAAALFLTACSRSGAPGAGGAAADGGASTAFHVALLTPGPVSDAGWNASAFAGLQLIKRKLGAQTALVQTTSPADFEDAFRDFAGRGFNLIFAHGFEYTDMALEVARSFPHTFFVVTSGSASAANVASLTFKIEEAAYVEGVLAGGVSKTGVVGAVGGIELPAIRMTFNGFRRGFLSVRPKGRVLVSYVGSFNDVGAAKEAALAQISRGADVLFHDADAAGLGVFAAAERAHVFAFGANGDQNNVAPSVVLASAVTAIPQAFLRIATEVKAGSFKAGMLEFGMREGMVKVVYNPRLLAKIPPAAVEQANRAEQAIIAGTVKLASLTASGFAQDASHGSAGRDGAGG
jgi:basic membrane protein A